MKNVFRTMILLACISSMGNAALAQKSDFSGSWQLSKEKSDFGQQDADKASPKQLKIKQQADAITVEKIILNGGQDNSYTETFTFDGKAARKVFTTTHGTQTRLTTVQWSADDKTMNISANTDVEVNGQKGIYTTEQAWTLSVDGKTLTINNNTVLPDRKVVFKAVYEKQ